MFKIQMIETSPPPLIPPYGGAGSGGRGGWVIPESSPDQGLGCFEFRIWVI